MSTTLTIRGKEVTIPKADNGLQAMQDSLLLSLLAINNKEVDDILRALGVHYEGYAEGLEEVLYPKDSSF